MFLLFRRQVSIEDKYNKDEERSIEDYSINETDNELNRERKVCKICCFPQRKRAMSKKQNREELLFYEQQIKYRA